MPSAEQTPRTPQRVVAYTDDPALADGLARLADGGRVASADVVPGGPRAALSADAPAADAILLDVPDPDDGEAVIAALAASGSARLIAIGRQNDVALYRRLCAAGASDYLVAPLDDGDLLTALQNATPSPGTVSGDGAAPSKVTLFLGCRGGVGATGLAVSSAWWSAEKLGVQTALIDLDLSFGTTALALDLMPGRGLRDALAQPERIDPLFVGSAMINATDSLFVLSAEEHPALDAPPAPDGLPRLVDAVAESVQAVVIDLPRSLLPFSQDLLSRVDGIVLVADLSLAGLRDAIRLRALCREAAPAAELTVLAVTPVAGGPAVDRKEFERAFEGAIDWVLPWVPKAAAEGAAAGRPVAAQLKSKHPYVKAVADIAVRSVPADVMTGAKKERRSWLW